MMNMIKILLVVSLYILPVFAYAQAPDTLWTRNYGGPGFDEGWQVKNTPDGGYIVAGYSGVPTDIYLIKTDSNGDTLWTNSFDYSDEDVGRSVEPLEDGGYIITGCAADSCVLIRTDSSGNELWHSFLDGEYGRAVRATADGNFIIAGYASVSGNDNQLYIAKADQDGGLVWSKDYGGTSNEMAWDVRETPDGGYVVLGWTESFGNGLADIYLIKTDSSGDSQWSKTYGGTSNDEGRSILVKEDGGFIIAGKISDNSGNTDIAVICTDSVGDTIWVRNFYDDGTTIANSIAPAYDGGYVIAGIYVTAGPISSFVIKINPDGDSLWSTKIQDLSQNLYCRSIVQSSDGGYVIAGYHYVQGYSNEVFLCKLAPDIVGIEDAIVALPENITLHQNYPNPFNASTTISFTLPEPKDVRLSVYDLLGRKVEVLVDERMNAGTHQINFKMFQRIVFLQAGNG
jgi:outer membrane protein assembly factor BamB